MLHYKLEPWMPIGYSINLNKQHWLHWVQLIGWRVLEKRPRNVLTSPLLLKGQDKMVTHCTSFWTYCVHCYAMIKGSSFTYPKSGKNIAVKRENQIQHKYVVYLLKWQLILCQQDKALVKNYNMQAYSRCSNHDEKLPEHLNHLT